jgi:hypothetical protein
LNGMSTVFSSFSLSSIINPSDCVDKFFDNSNLV